MRFSGPPLMFQFWPSARSNAQLPNCYPLTQEGVTCKEVSELKNPPADDGVHIDNNNLTRLVARWYVSRYIDGAATLKYQEPVED